MKCFPHFKYKSRSTCASSRGRSRDKDREPRSAPQLKVLRVRTDGDDDYSGHPDTLATRTSCSEASPSTTTRRGISQLYEKRAHNLRVFSFSELRDATNDFNRLHKIGEGGFGSVYKGSIKPHPHHPNSPPTTCLRVAIKKLNREGFQGHKQWVAEVQFLGVLEHPNLVKLIGYCAEDGERGIQRLLVYEFMPNKSLEDHLFNKAYPALPWNTRLQIILGSAQGLTYLHEGLEVQVIYRDFKSSNVLLDANFRPKLSDFGLAREGPAAGHTHVSTAVVGTYGYAAPDYIETGHLTTMSDVWSFGVVLYEIITGRRSLERNRPKGEQKLLEWVKRFLPADSKQFGLIMDPRLEGQYSIDAARKIAKLADSCLVKSAKDRPRMSKVAETLKQITQDSEEESPPPDSEKRVEACEDYPVEDSSSSANNTRANNQIDAYESWKRRMVHLAKLGENVEGVRRRRFMITQRAKVP